MRVAGFEILGVLGEGGMGIVYKARQIRLDRFVAIKMIRGRRSAPSDLARFEAEAQAVAAIEHPNIVRIFEIGEHDGLPYFSLEFLAGGSLAKQIGGKPQPVEEAARIVETLARAMDVAHRRGIVHRDMKPANVLLAADGTPKIADFGLVKRLEGDSGQTRHRLDPRHAELHGPRAGAPARRTRSGRPPTSTRWARPSTSCSPAGRRSGGRRCSTPSTRSARRSRCPRRSSSPRCPATSRRSA